MLYSLRGTIVDYDTNSLAIECGGVAYQCQATMTTLSQVAVIGKETMVFTHMAIRQDNLDLFAFADKTELVFFRQLITVTGVGPKAALSILSTLSPDKLALCIASGDDKSITAAPGVGKKIAQRIVLELKDKMSNAAVAGGISELPSANLSLGAGSTGEAISALVVLGYSQSEAAAVISKLDASMSVEDMIKAGLKAMVGK